MVGLWVTIVAFRVQWNMPGYLPGGCSAIQHDHLSGLNQLRGGSADGYFAIRR